MEKYHTVIIGSGPGGYRAALKIAEAGKPVCLIDKSQDNLGGVCLNAGCIPAKSFLETANLYQKIKSASGFGLKAKAETPDFEKIQTAAREVISQLKQGLKALLKAKKVNLEFGLASFLSKEIIQLESEKNKKQIKAENFILAAGSKPKELPNLKTDAQLVFNSDNLCQKLPDAQNLLIVGGGYIGCEFAHFYSALGKKVTLVEAAPSLLSGQDPDVARALEKEFRKREIEILTNCQAAKAGVAKSKIKVELSRASGQEKEISEFDAVIVAIGRTANTSRLNLAAAGIKPENGFIKVKANFKAAEKIYAIGDLINTPMLAHVAYREAEAAAQFILTKKSTAPQYHLVPKVVFSEPQISSFGLTELQAEEKKITIEVKKAFFQANPKACIAKETGGFIKLIFEPRQKKLLGAAIVGPQATELIHTLIGFARANLAYSEIKGTIYAHPVLSEIFGQI